MRGDVLVIVQTSILPVTCVITYVMSTVVTDHQERVFPFVSETGDLAPERCVFGMLFSFYAISSFHTMTLRWAIVARSADDQKSTCRINNVAFGLGIFTLLGILLAAHFQVTTQREVHFLGAIILFVVGGVYMCLNTLISFRVRVQGSGNCKAYLQLGVCCSFIITLILTAALGVYKENKTEAGTSIYHQLGVGSAACEWAMLGLFSLFYLTFLSEFRHTSIGLPLVVTPMINKSNVKSNNDNSNSNDNPNNSDSHYINNSRNDINGVSVEMPTV